MAAQPHSQPSPQGAPTTPAGAPSLAGVSPAELLRLDNQLCFPLYACSKEVVRSYQPLLGPLGLTYTQYLCMMVLWEEQVTSVRSLGERLYLDSGTLTPVLKKLEDRGYVTRERSVADARVLEVSLTPEGRALRDRAASVPPEMACHVHLSPEEAVELKRLLVKVLTQVRGGGAGGTGTCAQTKGEDGE